MEDCADGRGGGGAEGCGCCCVEEEGVGGRGGHLGEGHIFGEVEMWFGGVLVAWEGYWVMRRTVEECCND